jgi:hypothetical protein
MSLSCLDFMGSTLSTLMLVLQNGLVRSVFGAVAPYVTIIACQVRD